MSRVNEASHSKRAVAAGCNRPLLRLLRSPTGRITCGPANLLEHVSPKAGTVVKGRLVQFPDTWQKMLSSNHQSCKIQPSEIIPDHDSDW